jgi:hypothetical protein
MPSTRCGEAPTCRESTAVARIAPPSSQPSTTSAVVVMRPGALPPSTVLKSTGRTHRGGAGQETKITVPRTARTRSRVALSAPIAHTHAMSCTYPAGLR